MTRILSILAIILAFSTFHSGCIKSFEESDSATPRPASCDECHTFPGSQYCKTDTIAVNSYTATSCVLCHMGAIKLDSIVTIDTTDSIPDTITVFYDQMLEYLAYLPSPPIMPIFSYITATDSLHTNDKVDINFGQCTKCHGYPPNKDGHELHVIDKKKKCTDCHLFSITCSTYVLLDKTIYVPRKHKGLGKDSLFTPDPNKHLNGISGDIAFKQKEENANNPDYDTLYIWDPTERSCTNSRCHPPWHPNKLFWKEVKRK